MVEILSYSACLFVIILCITNSIKNKYKRNILFYIKNLNYYFSFLLSILKYLIILNIIFIIIVIYSDKTYNENKFKIIKDGNFHNTISEILEKNTYKLKEKIFENFIPASNVIIYYNGVTLEEGIKSTSEIDNMARELTKSASSDIEKAQILYSFIGSNLNYDYDRAEKALNNEKIEDSGAITAFEKRKGICFDYSCLYVAMARAINLNVRLLTGSAYDGYKYGPHAWNEVYIKEIDKWIPVDTTFYLAGNYFNNDDFYEDHITESIAGEW